MVVACGCLVGFANDTKLELAKTMEGGIKIQKISIDWKNELKLTRQNITRDNCRLSLRICKSIAQEQDGENLVMCKDGLGDLVNSVE